MTSVLFVNPGGRAQGGAERSLAELIGGLVERGHRCSVLLLADGDAKELFATRGAQVFVADRAGLTRARRHGGVLSFALGAAGALPAALATARVIERAARSVDADVIHSNGFRSHVLTALRSPRRRHARLVWSLRDRAPHWVHRALLRCLSRRADLVIANSEFTAELLEHASVATEVVPNPVAPLALPSRGEARAELGLDHTRPLVAVVAHLHPSKGHDVALDAVGALADLDAQLVVAGGDLYADSAQYRSRLEASAGPGRLRLLGNLDSIAPVYAAADVIVHPARHPEGFGRVVIEAQLARRPIIATDLGGVRGLIENNVTGLLVQPDDAAALARSIRHVLDDSSARTALVEAGARAAAEYSVERHVDRVVELYELALSGSAKEPAPRGLSDGASRPHPPVGP